MSRLVLHGMLGLHDRFSHETDRMLIGQPIEHLVAILTNANDLRPPQLREMLRDGSRAAIDKGREGVHRPLAIAQGENYPHPGRISQQSEHLNRNLDELAIRGETIDRSICVHA